MSWQVSSVVVCGVEAHVCVLATCQDLLQLGYEVHVAADCCSSRSRVDRELAYTRMQVGARGHVAPVPGSTSQQMGVWVTSAEAVILALVADSRSPHFRAVQSLVHHQSMEAGLGRGQEGEGDRVGEPVVKSSL